MTITSPSQRRAALLLGSATAGLLTSLTITAGPADAANECGAPVSGTVTCTSAASPYVNGISYAPITDLIVVTNPDVTSNGTVANTGTAGANVGVTNNGTISTTGAGVGGVNATSDTGNVTVSGTGPITTTGANAPGVSAGTAGTGNTVVNVGAVTTTGAGSTGISASNGGTGSTSVTATSVTTTGGGSSGIVASANGPVMVHVGTVSATGDGVIAVSNAGAATIVNTGTVTTTGAVSNAINAFASGPISITSGGAVAQGAAAITATSIAGNVTATVSGPATSVSGDGVDLTAQGEIQTTLLTVNANSTVSGGGVGNGVTLISGGGSTLINHGTITGGAGGFSVASDGGATTVTNTGVIRGPFSLGSSGNTVNNSGAVQLTGASSFGGEGTNVFNNTGTVSTPSVTGVTTPATVTVAGLTRFNNAGGTVDLRSGNSLNLGGAVFNGGVGSKLYVLGNSANGALTVGSTGTGTTTITSTDLANGTQGALNLTGTQVVHGASAGSFVLASGPTSHQGFVTYSLGYTPATGTYTLFGLPGREVFEALSVPRAAQTFFINSADAWTARAMEIRDSQVGAPTRAEGWELWGQPYGGIEKHNTSQTFSFGGTTFAGVGTRDETIGIQLGADMLRRMPHGYSYFGVTAGLEQLDVTFAGDSSNDLYLRGGNVGVYGGVNWGGLYIDALGKVDIFDFNTNFYTAGYDNSFTAKAYGGAAELGYRYPVFGLFIEPAVRVSGQGLDLDNIANGAQSLNFHSDTLVQGQAGGRIGATWKVYGMTFTPWVGGYAVGQSAGRNSMDFTTTGGPSGTTTIDLVENRPGTFTRVEYGVESGNFFGLKTFIKGVNDFGETGTTGWSATMGVRASF